MSGFEWRETSPSAAGGKAVPADPAWTPLEAWVWDQLQAGEVANLDRYRDQQGPLPRADPKALEPWRDGRRRLSSRFLEAILLEEPRRKATHRHGVRIWGAWFDQAIDLSDAELGCRLWLVVCRFEKALYLTDVHGRHISFERSRFGAKLDMQGADISHHLFMRRGAAFQDINLRGVRIGGQLDLSGADVKGGLDLEGAEIGQSLLMNSGDERSGYGATFGDIQLRGVKVGGQLNLSRAKVRGTLQLENAHIKRSLLAHDAEFQHIDFSNLDIVGQLSLSGTTIKGLLEGEGLHVSQHFFLNNTKIFDAAGFIGAAFEGSVLLGGAEVSDLDFHNVRIDGELHLTPAPDWRRDKGGTSRLNLRNASCDAIQDAGQDDAWPDEIELDGFTYKRFGGLGADARADVARRGAAWFESWLAKDKPFTRQPYHQCASVLREMGHPEMANDVLYEGRERERHEIWAPWPSERGRGLQARCARSLLWLETMLPGGHAFSWRENMRRSLGWFGLSLLAFVIGYGYGTRLLWRPLLWALAIVLCGTLLPDLVGRWPALAGDPSWWCTDVEVGHAAVCLDQQSLGWRFLFSLDMLLPIVELSREHTVLQAGLDGLAYGWFVVQRLLGWVLALFLIAGLSGLTK